MISFYMLNIFKIIVRIIRVIGLISQCRILITKTTKCFYRILGGCSSYSMEVTSLSFPNILE